MIGLGTKAPGGWGRDWESPLSGIRRFGFRGSEEAPSYRLAGPSSISQLLGNLLPSSSPAALPWKPSAFCTTALIGWCCGGAVRQGAEQSRAATPWGRVLWSHVFVFFFFFFLSSHPKPTGCSRVFQELSFAVVEPATPKMEAPCAAIKRKPSELFALRLRLRSPTQDGRPGSGISCATPNMASRGRRSGAQRVTGSDAQHTLPLFFFSAGRTVGCWARGAR